MKSTISILLLLVLTFQVKSQEFEQTEDYLIVEPIYELDSLFWATPYEKRDPITVTLTAKSDTTKHFQKFSILELDTYGGVEILSLKNPGLDSIKEIVLVQFEYFACCSSIDCHYFIITNNDNWIKLPIVNYVVCDAPEPFEEYKFPVQKFGFPNSIIRTTTYPNKEYNIDSVSVKETLIWDGEKIIE